VPSADEDAPMPGDMIALRCLPMAMAAPEKCACA